MRRTGVAFACALASVFVASAAWAAVSTSAPSAAGQQALTVEAGPGGVRAAACASGPCAASSGKAVDVPEAAKRLLGGAKTETIELENGRHVVRIVAADAGGAAWEALVAAPVTGQPSEPVVLWSGFTDAPRGDTGEEVGGAAVVQPAAPRLRGLPRERPPGPAICRPPA